MAWNPTHDVCRSNQSSILPDVKLIVSLDTSGGYRVFYNIPRKGVLQDLHEVNLISTKPDGNCLRVPLSNIGTAAFGNMYLSTTEMTFAKIHIVCGDVEGTGMYDIDLSTYVKSSTPKGSQLTNAPASSSAADSKR